MGGACSTYGGRADMYTGFWWGNIRERDQFGRPRRIWEDNIKMDLQEVGVWTGSIWLRRGAVGRYL